MLLSIRNIHKSYSRNKESLEILKGLSLDISEGETLCIVGASGAGKSTFLHILGTLDRPTRGSLFYRGESLFQKSDDQLAQFRNQKMGFVFQFHHLLSEFSALENVMMPARISGLPRIEAQIRAERLLSLLDMRSRFSHYPTELSGGEQQRVAIARALVCDPELLLADEPTGNLDAENSQVIQELFFELQREKSLTLVVVTHDHQFASRFPKTLQMRDGAWAGQVDSLRH